MVPGQGSPALTLRGVVDGTRTGKPGTYLARGCGWYQDREARHLSSFMVYTDNLTCSLFNSSVAYSCKRLIYYVNKIK